MSTFVSSSPTGSAASHSGVSSTSRAVTEMNKTNGKQDPDSAEGRTNETIPSSGSKGENHLDSPLPAELNRILIEVARTGSCSWLPWNISDRKRVLSLSLTLDPTSATGSNSNSAKMHTLSNTHTSKYALGLAIPPNRGRSRRSYTHSTRLSTSSPHYFASTAAASRRKHRNGVKINRRRLADAAGGGSQTQTGTTGSRKRPLFLIRTSPSSAGGGVSGVFSPESLGSGKTSGSEPDDSTQYECDSEGTSATSCSELSTERKDCSVRSAQRVAIPSPKGPVTPAVDDEVSSFKGYRCLKDAFRAAIGFVLDYWYRQKDGYKLSPAEKRRSETSKSERSIPSNSRTENDSNTKSSNVNPNNISAGSTTTDRGDNKSQTEESKQYINDIYSPENIFQQRRQRLLTMLGQPEDKVAMNTVHRFLAEDDGPPFTIQRIAEVLIAPERYYTRTHKLCNCLEKLLLVMSSTRAFGGSTGGSTSQSRLEERELAALAHERGRLESEFRQRALKRRYSSLSDDVSMGASGDSGSRSPGSRPRDEENVTERGANSNTLQNEDENGGMESSSREMLEAAARSLRTKFDHVGIDPHSSAVNNRDVRSIAENRRMTNSPPPPSLAMSAAAASNIALPGHGGVGNFVRHHLTEQHNEHSSIARVPSPILFSQGAEPALHTVPNMLQMHHAPSLGGVSIESTPFDLVTIEARAREGISAANIASADAADLEGRSSASNSDIDSESDDVSFDDSASDRSDGSDTGPGHYEPFTAARAMALNRIQQQQRLQSRVLTSQALHQSEAAFRSPADSEYQSGDSIDSTRGEDSGGSDSSSSDVAD